MDLLDLFVKIELVDNASAAIKTAGNAADGATTKFGSLASTVGAGLEKAVKVGIKALEKVGKAAISAGKYIVGVGSDFESVMSEVKAIAGVTEEEMDSIKKKAQEMGIETKFSATEAGEAMYYMAQAGWNAQQIIDGVAGVMDLAAASGEDLGKASDIVTDALTAFGLKAEESARFADVLAAAAAKSNTDVSKMGQTFKYVAPIAGTLGYSVEDVAVAIGLMANSGIKASQAGTSLRSVLSRLASPTDQVYAAMQSLGISLTNADGSNKSLAELIDDIRAAFSGLSEAEQVNYASTIASKYGMSGFLAIVNASDEDLAALTEAINNSSGAAKDMADIMQDNLKGKLEIFKSSVEGLGLVLYDYMVDPLSELAENGTTAVNDLTKAVTEGGLIAGLELLADNFGKAVTNATGHAKALFENLSSELSSEENHDKLRGAALGIAEKVSEYFSESSDTTRPYITTFIGNLTTSLTDDEARKNYVDSGYNIAKNIVVGISNLIQTGSEIVDNVVRPLTDSILGTEEKGKTTWVDVGKSIMKGIGDGIIEEFDDMIGIIQSKLDYTRDLIAAGVNAFNEFATIDNEEVNAAREAVGLNPIEKGEEPPGFFEFAGELWDGVTGKFGEWMNGFGLGTGKSFPDSVPDLQTFAPSTSEGRSSQPTVVVNQNLFTEAKTAADLMEEARYQAERAVLYN